MAIRIYGEEERIPWRQVVLASVALVGICTVAVLAPNALQSLRSFGYGKRNKPKKEFSYRVSDAINRAVQDGLLTCTENEGEKVFSLTAKGTHKLLRYKLKGICLKKPKQWDGKWRIIIFDIQEHKKVLRDRLRNDLCSLGFARLQYSVFVFPYDCEDVVTLLKADAEFGNGVLYIVADKIESDQYLRRLFRLR